MGDEAIVVLGGRQEAYLGPAAVLPGATCYRHIPGAPAARRRGLLHLGTETDRWSAVKRGDCTMCCEEDEIGNVTEGDWDY